MTVLDQKQLAALFLQYIESASVITDDETLAPYECDGLTVYREKPMLVVLPDTVEQIQYVVQICNQYKIPLVARGAGTGLSAGAMPHRKGVLLSLAKFNRVLELDAEARIARVEPGVLNLSISLHADEHDLYYAPDPSSQIACTIGGNVAENAGGVHCLKYGLTVQNVLQLVVITAEGEKLTLGSDGLDSAGFDLVALLTGSEGLLGIVIEVTVKLLPKPEEVQVVMAAFDDIKNACDSVGAVISNGIIPSGLEMMDHYAIVAVENFCHVGYPRDAKAILLCEIDGSSEEVAENTLKVKEIFAVYGATSTRVSSSEEERALLWKGRKSAFPAMGRISPDYYCMDGTIPRSQLAYVLEKLEEMSKKYELRIANVFHAGDGNLHPLILFDEKIPGEFAKAEAFGSEILELCVRVGGCITGEHGVGVEKIRQMSVQFTQNELNQFNAIKDAFDPSLILNPGKGVPVLRHCQEFRKISAGAK